MGSRLIHDNDVPRRVASGGEWNVVLLAAAFWAAQFVLICARSPFIEFVIPLTLAELTARRLALAFVGMALSLLTVFALRRLSGRPFSHRVLAAAILVLPAAVLLGFCWDMLFYYTAPAVIAKAGHYEPYSLRMLARASFAWIGTFFSWSALYLATEYNLEARQRERSLAQMEALTHKAQVRALRYQINPHFLFNALNSISAMIWERELERAETMLVSVSDFLRTTLEIDPSDDVLLEQEIALQRLYLDIEQIRFPDRLAVSLDVPPELDRARIPGLILQPIVENAIKYAVAPSKDKTQLDIRARSRGEQLVIEIRDDGLGGAPVKRGTGVGLENVRQRLQVRYGDRAFFRAGPNRPKGYRVELAFPLRFD